MVAGPVVPGGRVPAAGLGDDPGQHQGGANTEHPHHPPQERGRQRRVQVS